MTVFIKHYDSHRKALMFSRF